MTEKDLVPQVWSETTQLGMELVERLWVMEETREAGLTLDEEDLFISARRKLSAVSGCSECGCRAESDAPCKVPTDPSYTPDELAVLEKVRAARMALLSGGTIIIPSLHNYKAFDTGEVTKPSA